MPLIELPIPPGVSRNGSKRDARGRYYDANLIRWKNGKLKPIGGWQKTTSSALTGTARNMLPFKDNNGNKYIAVGTSSNLYIYSGSTSAPSDITPLNFVTGNATSAVGTGWGSGPFNGATVFKTYSATTISADTTDDSFNDSASGFSTSDFGVGDLIQVSGFTGGSATANNKTYSNSHRITAITTSKITVADSDLTTDTNSGGASITISKARNFGEDYSASSTSLVTSACIWTFDTWGDYLIASADSDGHIYFWNPQASNPLSTKADKINATYAPTSNTSILVSKERHLFALGAGGNPKKVQWSNAESYSVATSGSINDWTPSATNTTGSFELDTPGDIRSAEKVGNRILVFTDVDVHAIDYLGPPFIYGRRKLADSCGVVSRQATAVVTGLCAWMSYNGTFFIYDGVVRPLPCEVSKYIEDDFNETQRDLDYATANSLNNAIWWWYTSKNGTDIDRYVIWNYAENWWSIGKLERTTMSDVGVFEYPLAVGSDGHIYEHEVERTGASVRASGVQDPGTVTQLSKQDRVLSFGLSSSSTNGDTFVETGAFEIGSGERFVSAKQILTDSDAGDNAVSFKVFSATNSETNESESDLYALDTDGYTDIRESGRQIRVKIQAPFDQDFEISNLRASITNLGKR